MAGEGITFDGSLVAEPGTLQSEQIEMYCSDPRFLEYAARKRPEPMVEAVGNGFVSAVRDWSLGVNFLLGLTGVYGSNFQSRTERWKDNLDNALTWAWNNPEVAFRLVDLHVSERFSVASAAGRFIGGGAITALMLTGGRWGGGVMRGRKIQLRQAYQRASILNRAYWQNQRWQANLLVASVNFGVTCVGASALLAKHGVADIASVFLAILTGRVEPNSPELYRELFSNAFEDPRPLSPEETAHFLGVIEIMKYCLENPGSAVLGIRPDEEHDVTQHVPVGQVSSARPPGVMGSIPVGSETNMLDVISEMNALRGRQ